MTFITKKHLQNELKTSINAPLLYLFSAHIADTFFHAFGVQVIRDCSFLSKSDEDFTQMQMHLREGVCENTALALMVANDPRITGVIISTSCDQMRRAMDALPQDKVFLFNLPSLIENESAQKLYAYELDRLKKWIEKKGFYHDQSIFSAEKLLKYSQSKIQCKVNFKKINIALLGAPLAGSIVKKIMGSLGEDVHVSMNWLENGDRPFFIDDQSVIFESYADVYTSKQGVPDPFKRPATFFYERLKKAFEFNKVEGMIILHPIWCDQWRAVVPRCRELFSIPILHAVTDPVDVLNPSLLTRIEAFVEALKERENG